MIEPPSAQSDAAASGVAELTPDAALLTVIPVAGLGDHELLEMAVTYSRAARCFEAWAAGFMAVFSMHRHEDWAARLGDAEYELATFEGDSQEADRLARIATALRASPDDGAGEVGALLGLSPGTAGRLVSTAVALESLPLTHRLWLEGRIDRAAVRAMISETRALFSVTLSNNVDLEAVLAALEAAVLGQMLADPEVRLTARQVTYRARSAVLKAFPELAAERHRNKVAARGVWVEPLPDGMARLIVEGRADQIHEMYTTVLALADEFHERQQTAGHEQAQADDEPARASEPDSSPPADDSPWGLPNPFDAFGPEHKNPLWPANPEQECGRRRRGQDRFDSLHRILSFLKRLPGECWRASPPTQIAVNVTVPLGTALGISDEPGDLEGYGPITADLARELASDGVWQKWITEPESGRLLDLGKTRYRPTAALRRFLRARDRHCCFPGCNRSALAAGVEDDHFTPYPAGSTSERNMGPLCKRHHLMKTHCPGWRVVRLPDDTIVWVTPTGGVVRRPPDPPPKAPWVPQWVIHDEPPF